MHGKSGDRIKHGLRRDIDRNLIFETVDDQLKGAKPFGGDQERDGAMPLVVYQFLDDDFALGNEEAITPDKIALLNVTIEFDARIVDIVDLDCVCH
jgi:hypothetical protein